MNWKEIAEKYPKGFDLLVVEHNLDYFTKPDQFDGLYYDPIEEKIDYKLRNLYDFFDDNNIIIEIGIDCTLEPKYCFKVHKYDPIEIEWHCPVWSDLYLQRQESETAAFTKAFEILESNES